MLIVDYLSQGGFIMLPLFLCSLLIWAVVFEKVYSFKRFESKHSSIKNQALQLVKQGNIKEVKGLFYGLPNLIGNPYLTLISAFESKLDEELLRRGLQRQINQTHQDLKKSLWILGTIGSSAPFLGLFGTVVGIIKSFHSISETGKSGFAVVAAGLSEALIATAFGILVAVLALLAYNYFQVRLKDIILNFSSHLEEVSDELIVSSK